MDLDHLGHFGLILAYIGMYGHWIQANFWLISEFWAILAMDQDQFRPFWAHFGLYWVVWAWIQANFWLISEFRGFWAWIWAAFGLFRGLGTLISWILGIFGPKPGHGFGPIQAIFGHSRPIWTGPRLFTISGLGTLISWILGLFGPGPGHGFGPIQAILGHSGPIWTWIWTFHNFGVLGPTKVRKVAPTKESKV